MRGIYLGGGSANPAWFGTIEGDYHSLLAVAGKEYRTRKHTLSDLKNDFMLRTFGKNPNEISFVDVLRSYKSL